MKLLVTGGTGYGGSVVVAELAAAGHHLTVIDDLSRGHADTVPPKVKFHRLGIHDMAEMLTAEASCSPDRNATSSRRAAPAATRHPGGVVVTHEALQVL
jgi:nucleoside-diphosphate-sugar epimerase